jgi:hypothetical protein
VLTEVSIQHRVIPGIAAFARGGLPEPATTNDGNEWVDGYCWLYCGQQWTRVLWIGPANVAGAQAPIYACGPCIRELQNLVWHSILLEDRPASSEAAQPVSPGQSATTGQGAKHRRRRT